MNENLNTINVALVAQTAIALYLKSGLLNSRACAYVGEEPHFQWTDYSLVGRMNQAMNQN